MNYTSFGKKIIYFSVQWPKDSQITHKSVRNRRVTLEVTFKDHQVQLPEHFGAKWMLKHIAEGTVHIPLEHWQARGTNHLTRKPIPVFVHPHGKEMFR